jgi:hypothetical protein
MKPETVVQIMAASAPRKSDREIHFFPLSIDHIPYKTSYQLDRDGLAREKESETREMTFYSDHRIWRVVAKNGSRSLPLAALIRQG